MTSRDDDECEMSGGACCSNCAYDFVCGCANHHNFDVDYTGVWQSLCVEVQ